MPITATRIIKNCSTGEETIEIYEIPDPTPEEIAAQQNQIDAARISALWQAATSYEQSFIANMAIGLLTTGVIQQKPKALAIANWSNSLWNGPEGYYARKASGSTNCDYSNIGPMPYSVPELSAEVLG